MTPREAVDRLAEEFEVERVEWDEDFGTPRHLKGRLSVESSGEAADAVSAFLDERGDIYGVEPGGYEVESVKQDTAGNSHVAIRRVHERIRVYPSYLRVWVESSGVIVRIKAHWPLAVVLGSAKPKVVAAKALEAVKKARAKEKLRGFVGEPSLEYHIVPARQGAKAVLAWNFIAHFPGASPETEGFVVSAVDGKLLRRYPDHDQVAAVTTGTGVNNVDETAASPVRTIDVDDPGGGANLNLLDTTRSVDIETRDMAGATLVSGAYSLCADDDADGVFTNITNAPRNASDRPEVEAHRSTAIVHDYYARIVTQNGIALFGRTGWRNDPTQNWISLVHQGTNDLSSSFSRTYRVTSHGDGNGTSLSYKPTLDTCAHEWAHAVQMAEVTGGINPNGGFDGAAGENFIIKEATADMVAACINRDGGWRFAAAFEDDVALPGATHSSTGLRLRGFQTPSAYGQPDHYFAGGDTSSLGFAGTAEDYTRNGILDKAAYLAAAGGSHPNPPAPPAGDPATFPPITVYGIGCDAFENILYYTIVNLSGPADVFADFRQDMIDAANTLYPGSPCKARTIEKAFDAVGVYAGGAVTPPAATAGPDPMITPWGAKTGAPPYWQTPDIYVKDAADVITAPLKGQVNRLFALVTNVGTADAIGVQVDFSFNPYGAAGAATAKTIGSTTVDVPAGMSVEAEVAWDMTDLTDTNGGTWPAPLSDWDHFCVKVALTFAGDVEVCNNAAQNNFVEVADADGGSDGDGATSVMITNPEPRARWLALVPDHRVSGRWKIGLDSKKLSRGRPPAELVKGRATVPWALDRAWLIPLKARDARKLTLSWRVDSWEHYEGRAHGCMRASVADDVVSGALAADIRYLVLDGDEFEARVVGLARGPKRVVSVRGLVSGRVDRSSGRFEGEFAGAAFAEKREHEIGIPLEGRFAATASVSAVLLGLDEDLGFELGIPLVGDVRALCRPRPEE